MFRMKFAAMLLAFAVLALVPTRASDDSESADKAAAAKEALANAEAAAGKSIEKFTVKELKKLLSERGVQCAGCSEKSHILERVRETIHLPMKPIEEKPKPTEEKPKQERSEKKKRPSKSETDKDMDDLLAKLKGMPGGNNFKVFTKDDIEKMKFDKSEM